MNTSFPEQMKCLKIYLRGKLLLCASSSDDIFMPLTLKLKDATRYYVWSHLSCCKDLSWRFVTHFFSSSKVDNIHLPV